MTNPDVILSCPNKIIIDNKESRMEILLTVWTALILFALSTIGFFYWKNMTILTQISVDTRDFVVQIQNQKAINATIEKELSKLSGQTLVLDGRVVKLETAVFISPSSNTKR